MGSIAIVGAGPGGATLACLPATAGSSLLDRIASTRTSQ